MTESATAADPVATRVHDETGSRPAEYRPHLDGLRAIAVYLVVLFHAGVNRFAGGFYLWHWPVIVVATSVADPGSAALFALTALVATGLASLSYHLLEMPIRVSPSLDRRPRSVIAAGLAISLVGALVVAPAILDRPSSGATAVSAPPSTGFTPLPEGLDLDAVGEEGFGETVSCTDSEPGGCTVVEGSGAHILLMGDSNAKMMIPAFTALAEEQDLTLSLAVRDGCSWQRGLPSAFPNLREECERLKEDAYGRLIPSLDPDIVAVVNNEYPPNVVSRRALAEATVNSVPQLTASGATAVLIEPSVHAPNDPGPLGCLKIAAFLEDCRFVADSDPTEIELLYRELDDGAEPVVPANLDSLACPYLPICDPVIGGKVVRWNFEHLAAGYSATLGDELDAYLRGRGLLTG